MRVDIQVGVVSIVLALQECSFGVFFSADILSVLKELVRIRNSYHGASGSVYGWYAGFLGWAWSLQIFH